MTGWWQQVDADLAAADRALEREHQAAIAADSPWSQPRNPQELQASSTDVERGGRAARLDKLLGQAADAASRQAAANATQEAGAQYARIGREAEAQSEPMSQPQAQKQAEAEM